VGLNGAGKTEACKILEKKYGFVRFSLSDILRERLREEGKDITRNNLLELGNKLRKEEGLDYLAREVWDKIEKEKLKNVVVDSVRSVAEWRFLKEKGFVFIQIHAPISLRIERIVKRARDPDELDFESFKRNEERELEGESPESVNLRTVIENADLVVYNDGDLDKLEKNLSYVVENLERVIKVKSRPDWDHYFMNIAKLTASRSTCMRRKIGAVIVRDKRIISTGYNSPPAGHPHCYEIGGCLRELNNIPSGKHLEITRAVHAEQNAIANAARIGVAVDGATIYTTTFPCNICFKILAAAGIKRIVYLESYPDDLTLN